MQIYRELGNENEAHCYKETMTQNSTGKLFSISKEL